LIKKSISTLTEGGNLSEHDAYLAIKEILEGKGTHAQMASFLTALRMKGETPDEITGSVKAMREMAITLKLNSPDAIDTCGTGGDRAGTFNVSTAAAIVAAGAGVVVAKHGNRAVSGNCGSADVFEKLGVKITLHPDEVAKCINTVGIGFMFAPEFHSAMRHAAEVRREIGIRTVFNILGPLSNPAEVTRQVVGVYSSDLAGLFASTLLKLGVKKAYIVHGEDGLDEITVCGKTEIKEIDDEKVLSYTISPEDFGMVRHSRDEISGGDAAFNRDIIIRILKGSEGARRDIVLLNAAAAIAVSGKAPNIKDGLALARESIDSGSAYRKLQALIEFTQKQ